MKNLKRFTGQKGLGVSGAILQKASSDKKSEEENANGLTYKQKLKQDAMLWAEFLYSEYKREKAILEESQTMPTYYDNPDA